MLGLCFLEKGMPQLAIKCTKGLGHLRDHEETSTSGSSTTLFRIYGSRGPRQRAEDLFMEVTA